MTKNNIPGFIFGGAQKAGSSTLFSILMQHPSICLPDHDESHYFDIDENFNTGLTWYTDHLLNNCVPGQLMGEFTPSYLFLDYVPQRIYDTLGPDTKLIFLLRNPAKRAYSHYLMSKKNGFERLCFLEAIQQEEERIQQDRTSLFKFSYITRGYYARQLKRYYQFFPEKNIYVGLFEDLSHGDKNALIQNILHFLHLEPVELDTDLKRHQTKMPRFSLLAPLLRKGKVLTKLRNAILPSQTLRSNVGQFITKPPPSLSHETERFLIENYFLDEIDELEEMLQKDLSIWKQSIEEAG